jgi:hypothetical protein
MCLVEGRGNPKTKTSSPAKKVKQKRYSPPTDLTPKKLLNHPNFAKRQFLSLFQLTRHPFALSPPFVFDI